MKAPDAASLDTGPPAGTPQAETGEAGPRRARWFRAFLASVFGLKRSDRAVLAVVAPLFAIITGSSVIIATFTRAVFLTDHGVSTMPLMFLGSSIFTALASLGYVAVIEKVPLGRRFVGLLVIAEVSFAALHLAYPLHPKGIALAQLIWCTGLSHLMLIQTWNMVSALVPARQGKRLFPVLAAVSTLGAAVGGGLVSLLLKVIEARHLLWLVLLLLAWPLLRVEATMRALARTMAEVPNDDAMPMGVTGRGSSSVALQHSASDEITRGFKSILQTPLLLRLAALVFLLQVASLIIDFQFSTELKARYSRDEIAGFLGTYYAVANSVAFLVALFATGRIVRVVGIGMSISASAIFVTIGSAAYFLAATFGWGSAFWAIVAASFFERIGQFALTRNAMQMLVMPLETRKGERAKTLIDGVVYRVATALVSVALLLIAPLGLGMGWLAPFAIAACIGAVLIGLSMNPHYRRALFEGLRARRVDSDADSQTRELLVRTAMGEVRQRLASGNPKDIAQALEIVEESHLPVEVTDLMPLARHLDPEVARQALELMNDLQLKPERSLLLGLLTKDKPPAVLREVLRLLVLYPDKGLIPLVTQFVQHADLGVARLAMMWMKTVGGEEQTARINLELLLDLKSVIESKRARAAFISGGYTPDDPKLDLAEMLDDPSPQVRLNAVVSMGQIGSIEFIDPLVRCLGKGDLVPAASNALSRYGPALIGSIRDMVRDKPPGAAIQLRLLRIVERLGTPDAIHLLMLQADSTDPLMRNNAILSMWRMAREPEKPRPPHTWVRDRLLSEITRLRRYQSLESAVGQSSTRRTFFLSELQALRLQADMRGFRLLGLLHSRAAMHRAYLHYRNPQQRVRSTAIELLDQHIADPDLKPFVTLVERSEGTNAAGIDISGDDDGPSTRAGMTSMLSHVEPWLGRVWTWAQQPAGGRVARDPMDMVFLLKGVPLLSDLSGEQLLPVTDIVQHVHVEAGDFVFTEGQAGNHLYVILEGEVEVLRGGERVATLGVKECFGEMALLDQSARSASIRANRDVELLAISRDDFQDLLDMHPALARGVIRVLTQRLRVATEAVANDN